MKFLERIQSKPEHVRTRYVFGSAFIITALIAVVWGSTLPSRLSSLSNATQKSIDAAKDTAKMDEQSKNSLANVIESATQEARIKEETYNVPELGLSENDPYDKLRESAGTTTGDSDVGVSTTTDLSTIPPGQPTETTLTPPTETASTSSTPKTGTIILIGTTTSKKAE